MNPNDPPRELSGLAWGAFVSLGLVAILAVVRLLMAVKLHSAVTGEGDITAAYQDYSSWTGIQILVTLVAAGVFIAWFFRAYKNLRRLGVMNMRFGNGWAIGAWFIPIFNWIRPKQMANDVWRGSERGVDTWWQWRQVEVPGLVHWWWALFVAQGLVTYVGQRLIQSGYHEAALFGSLSHGLSQMKSGTTIDVLGQLVALGGVVLAINVVSQVTQRLDEIRDEAPAAGPVDPYAPPAAAPASYPPPPVPSYPPAHAEQRVRCPECAEWVQAQANVCRFCGHRPDPAGR